MRRLEETMIDRMARGRVAASCCMLEQPRRLARLQSCARALGTREVGGTLSLTASSPDRRVHKIARRSCREINGGTASSAAR